MLDRDVYMQEKYLCNNLEIKEGGGHSLEGGVFLGTYVRYMY